LTSFLERAASHSYVAVWRDLPADLETPVSAYLKLRSHGARFLLESVEGSETIGRFSFIGVEALETITAVADTVRIAVGKSGEGAVAGSFEEIVRRLGGGETVVEVLRERLAAIDLHPEEELPAFFGGAVGYFSYDVVRSFEHLPQPEQERPRFPDAIFFLTRTVVVFDHFRRTCRLVTLVDGRGDARRAYEAGVASLMHLAEVLQAALPVDAAQVPHSTLGAFESGMDLERYSAGVRRIQQYIVDGDAFQVVLSRRESIRTTVDPFALYRALRMRTPSPYLFYIDFPELVLVGASPEMLVKVRPDRVCMTRPIAGTRPRGRDQAEDRRLARELLADPKERAEHVMLVDLGRNDLGRVCRYGSVRVTQMMQVELYSHVMHIVSQVEGRMRADVDALDVLRAAFPAGTVSGSPKVRAMEIIDELEVTPRGPYAGAVGYVSYQGGLDTCIAIRTAVVQDGVVHLQAGAGIVADSDPRAEFCETQAKLSAAVNSLRLAAAGLGV
jgi:anthranilate synthase component 1